MVLTVMVCLHMHGMRPFISSGSEPKKTLSAPPKKKNQNFHQMPIIIPTYCLSVNDILEIKKNINVEFERNSILVYNISIYRHFSITKT